MELRQLEQFVAVAEERQFTRAALRLHLAQSGLSATVRSLERELGVPLFVRSTRFVELTEAGRALLVEARRVLEAAQAACEAVEATRQLLRGTLRVGTVLVMRQIDAMIPAFADILQRFRRAYPAVEVHLSQRLTHELLQEVAAGQLDIAFCGAVPSPLPGVTTVVLGQAPLQLLCLRSHPLSARTSVTLAELRDEPFVDPPAGSLLARLIDEAFGAAGLEHGRQLEVNDVNALFELVAQGAGIALFPAPPGRTLNDICAVPLEPPGPMWQLVAATPAPPRASAAAEALLAMLKPIAPA